MGYRVRPRLSYCLCEGQPIFLDIDTGRYASLPTDLCASFVAVLAGETGVPERDIARLEALRVIVSAVENDGPKRILPAPEHEVATAVARGWSFPAMVAQGLASYRLRSASFGAILANEEARQPSGGARDAERDMGRLRAAFEHVATLFGEADKCLPRSLAFRRLAFRRGHRPSLVIGVKIDPFAAHCWVQTGVRVESDSVERVRLFTPILVV
ncbi:lasso peptide biosynthesis B2 protein [Sphingomonas oryzagri]